MKKILVSSLGIVFFMAIARLLSAQEPHMDRKDRFVCPLGVIPLVNEEIHVTEIDLENGYTKYVVQSERHKAVYYISLSADRIENFIKKFAVLILPDTSYAILEVLDFDNTNKKDITYEYLTPFMDKKGILDTIQEYFFRIINDGDIGFGLAFYDEKIFDEVFITNKKTIIVYSSDPSKFEKILTEENINEFTDYSKRNFIENYPNASMNLFALADVYPDQYSQYKKDEFFTLTYTKELIKSLNFKENK